MRVISGIFKGRSIEYIKNSNTRPLKDNVRENIFNILTHSGTYKVNIENSNILDLYSGIGSFGIECMSRGAEKITFVDKDINATNILKKNLIKLSIMDKTKIYNSKIEDFLFSDFKEKFDIFFLDPPFKDLEFLENLKEIQKKKIFKKNHIVIIHREIKSKDNFEDILQTTETKKYGRSKIFFSVFK
tara:strand:+ start:7177 stop:7737 length:561 start_codon:yes stop_codon:yes gene_type:complete